MKRGRAFVSTNASRYGVYLSVVVNLFLVVIVLGVLPVPIGESVERVQITSDSEKMNGTMDLLMGHYTIRPLDSSYNSWGHAGYAVSESRLDNNSIHFNVRIAKEMGSNPARCVFIKVSVDLSRVNAPSVWESIGCEEERRIVLVHDDLLGEWYSALMTDRPTLLGPGYSFGVPADSPLELDISGVFLSTVGHANANVSSISRELIEYEGEIRWEYFPAISYSRTDWRSS